MLRPSAATNQRLGSFLDDHWILKWFVVPIWLLASVLLVLFLAVSTATTTEILYVVGLYAVASFAVVALGVGVEYVFYRVFGLEVFHSRTEYE